MYHVGFLHGISDPDFVADAQQARGLLWEEERKPEKKVVEKRKPEKVVKVFPVGGIDQAQAGEPLDTPCSVKTPGTAGGVCFN
jgi:hypothetical protein